MGMSAMRFEGFEWHHNPKNLLIKCDKKLLKYEQPYIKEIVESFYTKPVVISGDGEFYGDDCLEQYMRLVKLFNNRKYGVLTLPQLKSVRVCFDNLSLVATPTASLVKYTFSFTVINEHKTASFVPFFVTLNEDTTLFDVANTYNVDLKKLVEQNKDIMYINDLKKGQVIRLC